MSISIGDTISKLNSAEKKIEELTRRVEDLEGLHKMLFYPLKERVEVIGEWHTTSNTEKAVNQ